MHSLFDSYVQIKVKQKCVNPLVFKTILGCGPFTACDVRNRLTPDVGKREAFLRMRTASGWTGQIKPGLNHMRVSPQSTSFHIHERVEKNKYLH